VPQVTVDRVELGQPLHLRPQRHRRQVVTAARQQAVAYDDEVGGHPEQERRADERELEEAEPAPGGAIERLAHHDVRRRAGTSRSCAFEMVRRTHRTADQGGDL
jgi:hypothetical protein